MFTAWASDDQPAECPLCMEPLEIDDINFHPCECGYQICHFCWHRLRSDENGRCPQCRRPYSENPASFKPATDEQMQEWKKRNQKEKKPKNRDMRTHLADMRVLQKNLVFITGLSTRLANEEAIRKPENFGQYGKIVKVVVNSNSAYAGVNGPSFCAYVTYQRSAGARECVRNVNNTHIDDRLVKAAFGTNKYCSLFIKNIVCNKPDCMYLHELGDETASFSKQDMVMGKHTQLERLFLSGQLDSSDESSPSQNPTPTTSATRSSTSSASSVVLQNESSSSSLASAAAAAVSVSRATSTNPSATSTAGETQSKNAGQTGQQRQQQQQAPGAPGARQQQHQQNKSQQQQQVDNQHQQPKLEQQQQRQQKTGKQQQAEEQKTGKQQKAEQQQKVEPQPKQEAAKSHTADTKSQATKSQQQKATSSKSQQKSKGKQKKSAAQNASSTTSSANAASASGTPATTTTVSTWISSTSAPVTQTTVQSSVGNGGADHYRQQHQHDGEHEPAKVVSTCVAVVSSVPATVVTSVAAPTSDAVATSKPLPPMHPASLNEIANTRELSSSPRQQSPSMPVPGRCVDTSRLSHDILGQNLLPSATSSLEAESFHSAVSHFDGQKDGRVSMNSLLDSVGNASSVPYVPSSYGSYPSSPHEHSMMMYHQEQLLWQQQQQQQQRQDPQQEQPLAQQFAWRPKQGATVSVEQVEMHLHQQQQQQRQHQPEYSALAYEQQEMLQQQQQHQSHIPPHQHHVGSPFDGFGPAAPNAVAKDTDRHAHAYLQQQQEQQSLHHPGHQEQQEQQKPHHPQQRQQREQQRQEQQRQEQQQRQEEQQQQWQQREQQQRQEQQQQQRQQREQQQQEQQQQPKHHHPQQQQQREQQQEQQQQQKHHHPQQQQQQRAQQLNQLPDWASQLQNGPQYHHQQHQQQHQQQSSQLSHHMAHHHPHHHHHQQQQQQQQQQVDSSMYDGYHQQQQQQQRIRSPSPVGRGLSPSSGPMHYAGNGNEHLPSSMFSSAPLSSARSLDAVHHSDRIDNGLNGVGDDGAFTLWEGLTARAVAQLLDDEMVFMKRPQGASTCAGTDPAPLDSSPSASGSGDVENWLATSQDGGSRSGNSAAAVGHCGFGQLPQTRSQSSKQHSAATQPSSGSWENRYKSLRAGANPLSTSIAVPSSSEYGKYPPHSEEGAPGLSTSPGLSSLPSFGDKTWQLSSMITTPHGLKDNCDSSAWPNGVSWTTPAAPGQHSHAGQADMGPSLYYYPAAEASDFLQASPRARPRKHCPGCEEHRLSLTQQAQLQSQSSTAQTQQKTHQQQYTGASSATSRMFSNYTQSSAPGGSFQHICMGSNHASGSVVVPPDGPLRPAGAASTAVRRPPPGLPAPAQNVNQFSQLAAGLPNGRETRQQPAQQQQQQQAYYYSSHDTSISGSSNFTTSQNIA